MTIDQERIIGQPVRALANFLDHSVNLMKGSINCIGIRCFVSTPFKLHMLIYSPIKTLHSQNTFHLSILYTPNLHLIRAHSNNR